MAKGLLLTPKCTIPEEYKGRKIFFLAGPIRGGGGWQMRAAEMLWQKFPGCIVVDPTRWSAREQEAQDAKEKIKIMEHLLNAIGKKDESIYPSQTVWEEEHMQLASKNGELLFWLEKESQENPRPKEGGVYAQDTRVEIGIWLERVRNNPELKVKFGGHWEINENGKETENSFGGMNFIMYYLTGEKDRQKIYRGEISNSHVVFAKDITEFIEKSVKSEIVEPRIPKIPMN